MSLVLAAVNAVRQLPSFRAAQPSSVSGAVQLLLTQDIAGFTPVHHAAASGDRQLLAKLLAVLQHVRAPFATIDVRDKRGWTALQWAVVRGQSGAIKDLLDAGASASAEDGQGRSVLRLAVDASAEAPLERKPFFHDMVRFLLQCGADAGACDDAGASVVHMAAASGDVELLAVLVELGGAPVNVLDHEGESALFYAVREGQLQVVPKLLQYGCDAQAANESQESLIDYARSLGDQDVVARLGQLLAVPAAPENDGQKDKMELSSSAGALFSSGGAFPAMWSSNPAHLISH